MRRQIVGVKGKPPFCTEAAGDHPAETVAGTNLQSTALSLPRDQPAIKVGRLGLRPLESEDAPVIQRLAGEWAVARYTANIPHPYEDGMAEAWIESRVRDYRKQKRIDYAVEAIDLPDPGCPLVGVVSFIELDLASARAEIGYWLGQPYWGRGYASEACSGLLALGWKHLGLESCLAQVIADNRASVALLTRLGFVKTGVHQSTGRTGKLCQLEQYELTVGSARESSLLAITLSSAAGESGDESCP